MILFRPFQTALRAAGRNALDLPVAALAGLSVAFLAFAMPSGLMTDLVVGSGLPSILPAAEPPLGLTARAGVGLIGAVLVFGLVFLLLRLLDRTGLDAAARPEGETAPEADEALRVRRRDLHPDAPAPRPISAARELGEPAPPAYRAPARDPAPEPEEPIAFEIEADSSRRPDFVVESDSEIEIAPESHTEPETEVGAASAPASLAELMERLERGLARRAAPSVPSAAARVADIPVFARTSAPAAPDVADELLQSAIENLERLAARHS